MRIQEMRSGMTHLRKKVQDEQTADILALKADAAESVPVRSEPVCELTEPIWSVVSFDELEAGGLTHSQASVLAADLEASGVSGLCIVTDEAARRTVSR